MNVTQSNVGMMFAIGVTRNTFSHLCAIHSESKAATMVATKLVATKDSRDQLVASNLVAAMVATFDSAME